MTEGWAIKWRDIITTPPDGGQPVVIRRLLEATAGIDAVWSTPLFAALCGPDSWILPGIGISHWKARPVEQAPWPSAPPKDAAKYRDPYACPPGNWQTCWVRRPIGTTAVIRAQWSSDARGFTAVDNPLCVWAWHEIWQWKPDGTYSPGS
jgi:hypothetical protein